MRREMPENVKSLLENPNSLETLAIVARCKVLRRNWNFFCLAEGAGGKARMKLKEIAAKYKKFPSHVSRVVNEVRERLSNVQFLNIVSAANGPSNVNAYKKGRFLTLKYVRVVNAKPVSSVKRIFLSRGSRWKSDARECIVIFEAEGEWLRITGKSHLKYSRRYGDRARGYADNYKILWCEKADSPEGMSAGLLFSTFAEGRRLLVDYNGEYWVEGRIEKPPTGNQLIIHLERAVIRPDYCKKASLMTKRQKKLDRWRRDAERGGTSEAEWLGRYYYILALKRGAYERLRYGIGTEDDNALLQKILKYTKIAVKGNQPQSQVRLAMIYSDGLAGARDKSKARSLLEAAAMSNGSYTAVECVKMMKEGKTLEYAIERKRIEIE